MLTFAIRSAREDDYEYSGLARVYRIEEDDGRLRWFLKHEDNPFPHWLTPGPCGVPLPSFNYMNGCPVWPEEAIALTGIDHPMAAMDKLREMLYEGAQ
jgi:hypothetical protein